LCNKLIASEKRKKKGEKQTKNDNKKKSLSIHFDKENVKNKQMKGKKCHDD